MAIKAAQFTIDELQGVLRRRRKLFLVPFVLVFGACTIGAFVLPRKYESRTTILVQRDEVLNPLVNFTMAVSLASVDRLKSLNEIIYSRPTIEMLIDTLRLDTPDAKPYGHDQLIKKVEESIRTEREGPESFTLRYLDTDPVRSQAAAAFLANHFIETRLKVENQRNEYAVRFYESKLEELRSKFEGTQHQVITTMRKRINDMPIESRSLYTHVEETDEGIGEIDARLETLQRALTSLRTFPEALGTEEGKRALLELQQGDLPFGPELRAHVLKLDDLTGRYTGKYPEVEKMQNQLVELIGKMRIAVESEVARQQKQRWEMEKKRTSKVAELQRTSVAQKEDQDQESNYSIYQKLYDEMKIKLEQARTNRDLASKADDQFIIIDPPRVPTEPSKPNRLLIVLGGLGFGLFLGGLSAGVGELTDTRVRTPVDVEVFHKPIIAYLPEA